MSWVSDFPRWAALERLYYGGGSQIIHLDLTVDEAITLASKADWIQAAKPVIARPDRQDQIAGRHYGPKNDDGMLVECWCGLGFGRISQKEVGVTSASCGRVGCVAGCERNELKVPIIIRPGMCGMCGNPLPPGRMRKWCSARCGQRAYKRGLSASHQESRERRHKPKKQLNPRKPPNPLQELDEKINKLKQEIADLAMNEWRTS